jgi:hypothetical protein
MDSGDRDFMSAQMPLDPTVFVEVISLDKDVGLTVFFYSEEFPDGSAGCDFF